MHTAANAVIGIRCRLVTSMHTATDTIISIERHVAIPRMAARREEGGGVTIAIATGSAAAIISAVTIGATAASRAVSAISVVTAITNAIVSAFAAAAADVTATRAMVEQAIEQVDERRLAAHSWLLRRLLAQRIHQR